MSALEEARRFVRERTASLPQSVWNCERCGNDGSMAIRRSSLNEQFMADDVGLKCMKCWYYATHGIPFDNPEQFHLEMDLRKHRVLDFANQGPSPSVSENLAALGYLAKSEDVQ